MTKSLFDEFHSISAKQWKQKIQFDLKGADYNETLISETPEKIAVKPFYHADEDTFRATCTTGKAWSTSQRIYVKNAEAANEKGVEALTKGVDSLWFVIPDEKIDLSKLLKGIVTRPVNIFISPQFLSLSFVKTLNEFVSGAPVNIFLENDIIGNLAASGNWFANLQKDQEVWRDIVKIPGINTVFSVDNSLYQNAGAHSIQQLAYTLALTNEYFNILENHSLLPLLTSERSILFQVAIGSDYFMEIAKIRAMKELYAVLTAEYNIKSPCHIIAMPSYRNKTIYDYNVNMLRTTTEMMSGILGGADTLCNLPYDAIYHKDNNFGERISRNQLLILKHESYFDKVRNPADGAYYIETLTKQLAEGALELFLQIEKVGGFLKQLKEHTIQKKIRESAQKEQEAFNRGERVLVGTNKYPNPDDRMKDDIEIYPFVKKEVRKTLIEPVVRRRLSEEYEQERLEKENKK
ncbi:methylmalonyl-CoA mutase subunit beta [Ascidiimonas aurantiaca]|uniref:methylmalonyl-CoA mutase subunit beta n=1 Tax=Ascidiimonas aurantiaca TaxID=1685432 RepID=UPI0030EBEF21